MVGSVRRAIEVIRNGGVAVYPTETVYGLGADAMSTAAIDRVYQAKDRPTIRPLSIAFPNIITTLNYVQPSSEELDFMEALLPGPVTVLLEPIDSLPERLMAGHDRIGVRIPDHEVARALLEGIYPITATSANVSGGPNARLIADINDRVRDAADIIIDGGRTDGGESTVVNVEEGRILRSGREFDKVRKWIGNDLL